MSFENPDIPAEWFLAMTETASTYVAARFQSLIQNPLQPAPSPHITLDADMVIACDQLAECLNEAYRNPVHVQLDMVRYDEALAQAESGVHDDREDSLLRRFPPGYEGTIYLERPTVVVASEGAIVLWYLPGALSLKTQTEIWNATKDMGRLLRRSIGSIGNSRVHWRCQDEYFSPGSGEVQPGCINLAPAWFQQGHNPPLYCPQVSASLQGPPGDQCLRSIARPALIASAALRVMHPRQYWEGLTTMVALRPLATEMQLEGMNEKLRQWASVFSALSVVSNRETPLHRDSISRMQWFDILTSVGNYSHARMVLPSLQIEIRYDPGVMIGMSGRAVRHGVHRVDGDRICWAWYMRDNLHNFTKTPRGGFSKFKAGDEDVRE